ncbi:MAG: DinB family protein, partial [Nitrospira sp.]|nr:DinB family protein [Nitrospira sp.]
IESIVSMNQISTLNLTQAVTLLKTGPQTLRYLLNPLELDVLHWHPSKSEWSINEILGHLTESDHHSFARPIQMMLAQDWPELESWDPNAVVSSRRDNDRDLHDLLAEFEATRQKNVLLISELRPSQLARAGFHPQVGELQVVDFIYEWVYHDCNHIKQILSNIQLVAWPKMGNIRHFARPR